MWTIYPGYRSTICTPEAFLRADQGHEAECRVIGKELTCLRLLLHDLAQMGPFVDLSHPRIKIGDFDSPPSTIYEARFLNPLKSFLEASPESIVLLFPSVRDLLSDHAVYPQSELSEELTGGHPVRLLYIPLINS